MPTSKKTTRRNGAARSATTNGAKAKPSPACNEPVIAAQKLAERTSLSDGQDLTDAQRGDLLRDCEALIEKHLEGFVAVGTALRIVRDEKLYEDLGYDNFEAYCQDRWDFKRARASQLIAAASVAEAVYNCKQIARRPTNEAQVRPLVNLEPKQQIAAWKKVVKKAGDDNPITAKMVEDEAAKLTSKGMSSKDAPKATAQEESPAERRKRFAAHCALLEKLEGNRPSKKQKALKGALDVHTPKFLDEVVVLARRRGDKLSKEGARHASGVTGDEITVGLLQKLKQTLADTDILDLLAPIDNDNS